MEEQFSKVEPHKVTKPIQLLAAWLAGLVTVNGTFLLTASQMDPSGWASFLLVIAAILNVPMFLVAIFVLQTRFRPELQEDRYYSEYLDKKTGKIKSVESSNVPSTDILNKLEQLQSSVSGIFDRQADAIRKGGFDWRGWKVSVNNLHPNYSEIVNSLADASIPIQDTFGESGVPPDNFLIAFRSNMDITSCVRVLRYIGSLNFDGYYYFEDETNFEEDDVYLGPYDNPNQWVPINDELIEIVTSEKFDSTLLRKLESKYKSVQKVGPTE